MNSRKNIIFYNKISVIAIFVTINIIKCSGAPDRNRAVICTTQACNITASSIIQYMDASVNPCEDFYQFACGNFVKNAIIRSEHGSNHSFTMIEDNVEQQLKRSVESINKTDGDPEVFKKLRSYFDVCMNQDRSKMDSSKKFKKMMNETGGWPVMMGESWNSSEFSWVDTAQRLREQNFSSEIFFSLTITVDIKNNTRRRIYITEPGLGLSREFLLSDSETKVRSAYLKLMENVTMLLGCDNKTRVHKELDEVLQFKRALAEICLKKEEARDPNSIYHPMTVDYLQEKYPYIPWLEFINNIFKPHKVLNSTDTVILTSPKYFEKLSDILAKTDKRIVANFIYWQTVFSSIGILNKPIKDAYKNFSIELSGINATLPRWRQCLSYAISRLPLATGALYVRSHFDHTKKEKMETIVKDLNTTFAGILENVDWMDDITKKAAIEKLGHMTPQIAYPNELLDDDKLNQYYKDLTVDTKSMLNTELNFNRFLLNRAVQLLNEPVKRFDWTGSLGLANTVNAFYSPIKNSIEFPSGILQHPFFNADNPRYTNYAGIGVIVGHEMTHGFDDTGRKFDLEGRLNDWWKLETEKKFLKKAECIVHQYSNYTSKEANLTLNGNHTQGENIADNGGIKLSYIAYDNWQKVNLEEPRLPGLESYTPKQLFWISYAHGWCTKYRPEIQKLVVLTDTHSTARYRVIGPISNRPEFSQDFNCPVGSPMNPEKKCDVW